MENLNSEEIIKYIRSEINHGKEKEEIYRSLLDQGLRIDAIQDFFSKIEEKEEKEDSQKKSTRIVIMVGAVLIAAGIFSFIAANWQYMGKASKMFLVIASMLFSYGFGWYLKEKLNYLKTGEALFFLGSLIYGATIFLTAQIFSIQVEWPDGFIFWMIGLIFMAFAVESYSIFYLAILTGFIAIIGSPFYIFDAFSGYNPFLLTSGFLLVIATIITFITGWFSKKQMPQELKEYF